MDWSLFAVIVVGVALGTGKVFALFYLLLFVAQNMRRP